MTASHRFVIGIDFGTTYSAVAWALVSNPKNIQVVKKWPTSGQLVRARVPTEIAFAEDKSITWGYNINPRSKKIMWFKLGLESTETKLNLPVDMDVISVVRDYLRAIHSHITLTLTRMYSSAILDNSQYDYVLTVPAMWTDIAKTRTRLAANSAGIGLNGNSTLELFSEPESAAIYTLMNVENFVSRLQPLDKIVVCDAGGGTVDLISYEIKQLKPLLKLEECTAGVGEFCGGSFIDRDFEKFFQRRLGTVWKSISVTQLQQVFKSYELSKLAFRDDPSQTVFYIHVPNVANLPTARIYDHYMELSRDEMRTLFDPIVSRILGLIEEQVRLASGGTNIVRAVLLVGGFGESDYLYKCVQKWASRYHIEVLQPSDASLAVVQGAVIKGLEARNGGAVHLKRRARLSYGISVKEPFIEGLHRPEDATIDSNTRKKIADNQVRWFININQEVDDEKEFRFPFRRTFTHLSVWEDSLFTSSAPAPSTRMAPDVHRHCTIKSDLTSLQKSDFVREKRGLHHYYVADYELVLSLRNNNMNLSMSYRGKRYGVQDVNFEVQ